MDGTAPQARKTGQVAVTPCRGIYDDDKAANWLHSSVWVFSPPCPRQAAGLSNSCRRAQTFALSSRAIRSVQKHASNITIYSNLVSCCLCCRCACRFVAAQQDGGTSAHKWKHIYRFPEEAILYSLFYILLNLSSRSCCLDSGCSRNVSSERLYPALPANRNK